MDQLYRYLNTCIYFHLYTLNLSFNSSSFFEITFQVRKCSTIILFEVLTGIPIVYYYEPNSARVLKLFLRFFTHCSHADYIIFLNKQHSQPTSF